MSEEQFFESELYFKLECFVINLLRLFEQTFDFCLDLVGNSPPILFYKPQYDLYKKAAIGAIAFSTKTFKFIKDLELDVFNDFAKNLLKNLEKSKVERKKSKLSWLVYEFSGNKMDELRMCVIQAAIEIFVNYEPIFKHTICDDSGKKSMQILAYEATSRMFSYFKNVEKSDRFRQLDKSHFTKAFINSTTKPSDYKINFKGGFFKSNELFDNVGIINDIASDIDDVYYRKNDIKSDLQKEYRKKFDGEKINKDNYKQYDENHSYDSNFSIFFDKFNLIEKIEEKLFLISKSPQEQTKIEAKHYHEEQMQDRSKKHNELMEYLENEINGKLHKIHSDVKNQNYTFNK